MINVLSLISVRSPKTDDFQRTCFAYLFFRNHIKFKFVSIKRLVFAAFRKKPHSHKCTVFTKHFETGYNLRCNYLCCIRMANEFQALTQATALLKSVLISLRSKSVLFWMLSTYFHSFRWFSGTISRSFRRFAFAVYLSFAISKDSHDG